MISSSSKNKYEKNYVDLYIKTEMNDEKNLKIEQIPVKINAVKVIQEDKYTFIYQNGLTNAIVLEVHNGDDSFISKTNYIYNDGDWSIL